jgi:putative spermidine/putrescine transport system ATP-binding protein
MAYLELKNVSKAFGGADVVHDFSLDIDKGTLVSFLGPSGCGKTTTLRMIAGFEQLDHGTIQLDGADITAVPPNRRDIGMVFQAYALFPNKTVRDNIAFGLRMKKTPKSEISKKVNKVLEMVRSRSGTGGGAARPAPRRTALCPGCRSARRSACRDPPYPIGPCYHYRLCDP